MRQMPRRLAILIALTILCSGIARAQEPVGSVTALEGTAEVRRAAADWAPLANGDPLFLGDVIRTMPDSKARLLFRGDTVLTLAASSELTVDEDTVGAVSRFSLGAGLVRALVPSRYGAPGASFEVETPTAIAGVRGTEFVASYDHATEETLVLGVTDTTRVRGRVDPRASREVAVGPNESVIVRRGSVPLTPTRAPGDVLRRLLGATDMRHGGRLPERELKALHRAKSEAAEPRTPRRPSQGAVTPDAQVVDQPIQELDKRQRVPPPPPPPPR